MFGKSEWFAATPCGCVAKPASRSGWLYLLAWAAVLILPAVALSLWNSDWLVPAFWLLPATAMFLFDLRTHTQAVNAKKRREQDVFFIGFDGNAESGDEIATRNYDLRLRR